MSDFPSDEFRIYLCIMALTCKFGVMNLLEDHIIYWSHPITESSLKNMGKKIV